MRFYLSASTENRQKKTPTSKMWGFGDSSLAVTYFRMGRPHTIIGDALFHF